MNKDGVETSHPLKSDSGPVIQAAQLSAPLRPSTGSGGWGHSENWYDFSPRKRTSVLTSTSVAPRRGRAPDPPQAGRRVGTFTFQPLFICGVFFLFKFWVKLTPPR